MFCPKPLKVNISIDCAVCPGNAEMWAGLSSALHSCIWRALSSSNGNIPVHLARKYWTGKRPVHNKNMFLFVSKLLLFLRCHGWVPNYIFITIFLSCPTTTVFSSDRKVIFNSTTNLKQIGISNVGFSCVGGCCSTINPGLIKTRSHWNKLHSYPNTFAPTLPYISFNLFTQPPQEKKSNSKCK